MLDDRSPPSGRRRTSSPRRVVTPCPDIRTPVLIRLSRTPRAGCTPRERRSRRSLRVHADGEDVVRFTSSPSLRRRTSRGSKWTARHTAGNRYRCTCA